MSEEQAAVVDESLHLLDCVELLLAHASTLSSLCIAYRAVGMMQDSRARPQLLLRIAQEVEKLREVGVRL